MASGDAHYADIRQVIGHGCQLAKQPVRLIDRPLLRCDLDEEFLYGVVAVAVVVPVRQVRLGAAGEIGGPGADGAGAGLVEAG